MCRIRGIESAIRGLGIAQSIASKTQLAESKLYENDCLEWLRKNLPASLATSIETEISEASLLLAQDPAGLRSYHVAIGDSVCANYVEAAVEICMVAIRVIDAATLWIEDDTSIEDWISCPRRGLRMALTSLELAPIHEVMAGLNAECGSCDSGEYSPELYDAAEKLSRDNRKPSEIVQELLKRGIWPFSIKENEFARAGNALKRQLVRRGRWHSKRRRGRTK